MTKRIIFCCIAGDFLAEKAIFFLGKRNPEFARRIVIFSCIEEALNIKGYIPVLFFTPSSKTKIKLKQNLRTAAHLFLNEPVFKITPYLIACLNNGKNFDSSVRNIAKRYFKYWETQAICPWVEKAPTNYEKLSMFWEWKSATKIYMLY